MDQGQSALTEAAVTHSLHWRGPMKPTHNVSVASLRYRATRLPSHPPTPWAYLTRQESRIEHLKRFAINTSLS